MERSTPSGRVRRWVIFRAGWHALSRAWGADTRAANLPLCAPILARIVPQFSDSFQAGWGRVGVLRLPTLPSAHGLCTGVVETSDLGHRLRSRRGTEEANH